MEVSTFDIINFCIIVLKTHLYVHMHLSVWIFILMVIMGLYVVSEFDHISLKLGSPQLNIIFYFFLVYLLLGLCSSSMVVSVGELLSQRIEFLRLEIY